MRSFKAMLTALAVTASTIPATALAHKELVLEVPGSADFLAIDGESVWATNVGRVERWSRQGKLAEVAMSRPCGAMAIHAGSLWVADCKESALVRIDTQSNQKLATIPTGIANPKGELNVVAGAGSIWVASDQKGVVSRIDPTTNKVIATIKVSLGTHYLTFGYDALWAVSSESKTLQRIDPATNTVVRTTMLGKEPGFLAAGVGAVWVQEQGDGTVARVNPTTGDVTGRVKVGDVLKWGDIDTGAGLVWLRTTEAQTFVAIDPVNLIVLGRLGKAEGSGALRFATSGLWTSAHDVKTITWWPEPVLAHGM